jgi:hypothetical protein
MRSDNPAGAESEKTSMKTSTLLVLAIVGYVIYRQYYSNDPLWGSWGSSLFSFAGTPSAGSAELSTYRAGER